MNLKNSNLITSSKCFKFAEDVLSGKIVSGKKRIQASSRFMEDLKNMDDPEYPWVFDINKAYRPIEFIEKFLRPTKSDYDRMELLPWQHFVEGNLYGWVSKKTGYRRFRKGLIVVGSGNGKSTMVVGNAAFAAAKDGEPGAEVYCLANSKQQARIIFNECKAQIENSPLLKKYFRATRDGIYYDKTNSVIMALASESTTIDGLNVHLAIYDEGQDYKDYALINRIDPKMKKRRQAMSLMITTLGTVIDGPLMDYYMQGQDILSQSDVISQRAADRTFVYIDEIDEGDDPADSTCWGKANPSLGKTIHLDDLLDEWERVKLTPSERSNFINKQLNIFTQVDELSFLDADTIHKNNKTINIKTLEGESCYGGFDLSEREDFTSACLEFPLDGGQFFVLSHSWVPRKKLHTDHERLDWQGLVEDGALTVVDGDYVDYNLVFGWFETQKQKYRIQTVGYDMAKAFLLVNLMQSKGYTMNEVRQGQLTLTDPLDDMKERFLDGNIIHNNNRLYRWYLGNVKLTKRSHNATYLPTKQNKYRKIDGFAAHLNAHTEWLRNNPRIIPPDKVLSTVIRLGGK